MEAIYNLWYKYTKSFLYIQYLLLNIFSPMKYLITLILVMVTSLKSFSQIQEDTEKHFITGMAVSAFSYNVVYDITHNRNKAVFVGILSSFVAGTVKELIDNNQPGNRFDSQDLVATGLGGITMSFTINLVVRNKRSIPYR